MTVHFIGAGPGDPDLITVRGLRLIKSCALCLYAGSLVPQAVVAEAPDDARILDTAAMTLNDIIAEMEIAHKAGRILRGCILVTHRFMVLLPNRSGGFALLIFLVISRRGCRPMRQRQRRLASS